MADKDDPCEDQCCAGLTSVPDRVMDPGQQSLINNGDVETRERSMVVCAQTCCTENVEETTGEGQDPCTDDCCASKEPSICPSEASCEDSCCQQVDEDAIGAPEGCQGGADGGCADCDVSPENPEECTDGCCEPEPTVEASGCDGCTSSCKEISDCCSPASATDGAEPKDESELDLIPVEFNKHKRNISHSRPEEDGIVRKRVRRGVEGKNHHQRLHRGDLGPHDASKSASTSPGSRGGCDNSVFARFYEAACCCVLNKCKPAHPKEAKKQKKSAVDSVTKAKYDTNKKKKSLFSQRDVDLVESGGGGHVRMMSMSIQGMDCPSCATRVTKALQTIQSVSEPKINVFAGHATLKYDDGVVSPEDIVKRASTLTGFACKVEEGVISPQERRLLVQVDAAPINVQDIILPSGVEIKTAKQVKAGGSLLDIRYDPGLIPPRKVLTTFVQWNGKHVPFIQTNESNQARRDLVNLLTRTLISAVCCIPVLVFSWAPLPQHPITYGSISLALTTIIQVYVAAPIYSSAFRSLLLQHIIDMDLLVVMSTGIAYIFSVVAFAFEVAKHPFSDQFFETSSLLVTLIMAGRLMSTYASRRASSALDKVSALQVHSVDMVHGNGRISTISEELVHMRDVIRVLPDTLVPTDGMVVQGASEVDESSITGESFPVAKKKGSELVAGTLNLSGVLDMSVERLPNDNSVTDITRLMREIQDARLPVQDRADKVASYLAPVVLVLSIITFLVWIFVGLYVRHQSRSEAGIGALKYAIAVMVISCPCAIALAVPMVIVISVAVGAKHGILFKSILAVQYAKDVRVAIFDKTGTLTEGKPQVQRSFLMRKDAAALALALTSNSKHPVAKAMAEHLKDVPEASRVQIDSIQSVVGKGLEAIYDNRPLRGGNPEWLGLDGFTAVQELKAERLTIFALTHDNQVIAVFGLSDTIRDGAFESVELLQKRGVEVYIVSGDEPTVVNGLAEQLGLSLDHAYGGCTPQSKQEHVQRLKNEKGRVIFFGDGTNDSLALLQADIGVSFGTGTDVAMSAADVVILEGRHLSTAIQTMLRISEGAVMRIKGNFAWSLVYNTVAVLFAAGAFVHARISAQYAGLGEMVSVLPVVLVAWSMWFV